MSWCSATRDTADLLGILTFEGVDLLLGSFQLSHDLMEYLNHRPTGLTKRLYSYSPYRSEVALTVLQGKS